jgi:hypothetical protein
VSPPFRSGSVTVPITVASAKARFARLGLIHLDVPALEFGIVELMDRVGNFFRSVISTKPKPFDCPENLSAMTVALCT